MAVLTIGEGTRDGLLQIIDTSVQRDGSMNVSVRELIGGGDNGWIGGMPIERMRKLAKRAVEFPGRTRTVKRYMHMSCGAVTFNVESRECSCGESDVYDGYAECSVHPA